MSRRPLFASVAGILVVLAWASFASGQQPDGTVYGFVSFSTTRVEVQEDSGNLFTTVQLPLVREVGTTGPIIATVEVTNSSVESDFFSSSNAVSFSDGQTTATALLLLQNDDVPEGEETFIVQITGTRFGAAIGAVDTLVLIVSANDEPHGEFQFDQASQSQTVSESSSGDTIVQLTVERSPGTFGRVTVNFQVTSGPNLGLDDLSPTQGQLVFPDRVGSQTISISVTADEFPEEEETFTISLSNPSGGASLASSGTEANITVRENDTPIRFAQTLYTVEEDAGTVVVTVTRGMLADGTQIGDVNTETTVQYSTSDGTAVAGADYTAQSGSLTFASGVTSQTISIAITNDSDPEGDETFSLSLSSPSSDAVLSTPSSTTVQIEVSDNAGGLVQFASAGPVVVGEDDGSIASFTVQRLSGTFGDIIVEWQIVEQGTEDLATDDFQTTRGNLTILDGEDDAILQIQPLNDATPEIAEQFSVELVGVVSRAGELHPMGPRLSSLIVEDSDDVYGLVEVASDSQLSTTNANPRQLHLEVARSEGTVGTISVDYWVTYLPAGVSDPSQGNTSVLAMAAGSVRLVGGQAVEEFDVQILNEAFLDENARFYVRLNSTFLVEGVVPLVTPTNSPRIGSRSEAFVSIPTSAANGYISFQPVSRSVSTTEPESGFDTISLELARSAAYGRATVSWAVVLVTADGDDLGTSTGVDTIEDGSTSEEIFIVILNDDEPEIDETFEVQLVSVAESNQRIDTEEDTATVTILLNDNAEGIFSLTSSQMSYTIEESTLDVISITIQREEGSLTTQTIIYQMVPGTGADFIGGVGFVEFVPGQTENVVTLLPNDDDIPENTEVFNFTISAGDGNDAVLGSPVALEITILPNDDYAGVFRFEDSSLNVTIDEPGLDGASSTATLTIVRDAGSFTEVTVDWEVTTSGASTDISPTTGNVTFSEGQTSGTFTISALEDETPDDDLHYTVALTAVSGDARFSSSSTRSTLTVRHNDDPINLSSSFTESSEGDTVEVVVARGGHANGVAEVTFQVSYSSASAADVTITPSTGSVTLMDGQTEASITVDITDDAIPEETESLQIELTSASGDAVLVSPTMTTLNILPSDDPNGVFQFTAASRDISAEEGDTLQMTVERLEGSFGTVELQVTSYLLNTSSGEQSLSTAADLNPTTLLLSFLEGDMSKTFDLDILDESSPEFEETFEIELTIEAIDGDSDTGARLGNFSVATVVVAENDDPYGLFIVSMDTREVEVAEDVPTGQPELGRVTVGIERTFGDADDVQVLWDVVPEMDPPLPLFTDLLFFGTRGSAVSTFQSRNNTGTVALEFTGEAASVVTVPVQYHPGTITNQLTIAVWLQITTGSSGVLVAKTPDGGSTQFYALEVSANGGDFLIRFSYLPGSSVSGSSSVEVSVTQSSLADGDWHSLAVAVNGNTALFYQDGSLINSRTLEEASIRDAEGELTVGGLPSGSFFTGVLQDVRVYESSLSQSQISAIGTDETALSLTPISGYLSFPNEANYAELTLTSQDDLTPEPSTVFTLRLANSDGGSRIEQSASTASVTVLKSDAANGVFGFDPSSLSNTITEPGTVSLTVRRQEGDYGSVTLHWEVQEVQSSSLASSDFAPPSGTLEFAEGDHQEVLTLQPIDESTPELDEDFAVILVQAIANDGQTSSTPTSGASISADFERSNLTVTENDYPYGLLQFATSPPPSAGIIPPATTAPEVMVRESDGTVTIYIVRAQGNLGTISAEYLTTDGTATSMGVSPDYVSQAGTAEFGSEDRQMSVSLSLVDDSSPELGKEFYVNLTNPAGDVGTPSLGIGSTLTVRILPSDNAFGVFSFSSDSLARVVSEQDGGTAVQLTIQRQGGSFESIAVYWEVEGGGNGDISPASGQVNFDEGQTEGELVLTVNNDVDPELEEVFSVTLLNATGGATVTTGGSQVATITIQANDHPYGLFGFSSAFRPLSVSEGVGEVEVMVTREFGTLGTVTVEYSTVESGHSSLDGLDLTQLEQNSSPFTSSQLANSGEDYTFTSGMLEFTEGELIKSFSLSISDDSLPETDEYVFIAITSVELDVNSVTSVDTSVLPTTASGNGSLAFVVISENDDARGVLGLSSSAYDTSEPSQNFVIVNRDAGTFGTVSVQWEAAAVTAQTADFAPQGGTVQIPPDTSSAQLPLSIINDDDPEFSETLSVSLLAAGGGARLGNLLTTIVTIQSNDDPNGALEFAEGSRSVQVSEPEGSTSTSISLTVERTGGATGVITVSWSITADNGDDASLDIVPVTGTLQFISNVQQQLITLSVVPDDVPEVAETFTVSLTSATGGARIADSSSASVEILPNDNPYGVVSFSTSTFAATEAGADSLAMVPVVRSLGTFGAIRVLYTTLQQSAEAGSDFISAIGEEITIPEGISLMNISVEILADNLPELNETFQLLLNDVTLDIGLEESGSGGPLLGAITTADIVIVENDDPYGRFHITGSSGESTVRVEETANLGVSLEVERRGGTVGRVQVTWSVTGGSATEGEDFAGSGAVLTFDDQTSSNVISLILFEDSLPERDEDIVISLSNPTGGAVLASNGESMVTVIIGANDNAGGIVGLAATARSAIVSEGETVSLAVERSVGNLGVVEVDWEISGPGNVTEEFVMSSGTATFEDGSSSTAIVFQVAADGAPELAEIYSLSITGVRTVSLDISQLGIAELDSQATMATITVEASDNPHGVVEFQSASVAVESEESSPVILTVVREFGTIGILDVTYEAVMGNLGTLEENTTLATPGADFNTEMATFRLEDGQESTTITAPILDDNDPELSEVFLISLVSVTLVGSDGDIAPFTGASSQAQVTILPNDNPEGILTFRESRVNVTEDVGDLVLTVYRDQGLVGRVSVFAFAVGQGATIGTDFNIDDLVEVEFASGVSQQALTIGIVDDEVPELSEVFCVRLILPEGGAVLGDIVEVCVTILTNDDAHGEFSFDANSVSVVIEESGAIPTAANVAELRVVRSGGVIGEVTLPFEVEQAGIADLSPASGTLVFAPNENFRILQVTAVMDDFPELDETYSITLMDPDTLGDLSDVNSSALITILANQNPHGLLELFPVDSSTSSLMVEEDVQYIELEIRRSYGTFGEIMVTINSVEESAVSPTGDSLSFTTRQFLETTSAEKWYQFSRGSKQYLVLASSSPAGNSVLFEWRGAFVPIQTLATVSATAATFLSIDGRDLLVISNGGSPGNKEVNSTVYEFTESGDLEVLHNIVTTGASDVVSLQAPNGEWYLVFASREDSEGSPNVDSVVLRWNGERFELFQSLATIGASAADVFSIADSVYIGFASYTDTRSPVYIWRDGQFRLHQNIDSQQASDMETVDLNGNTWLTVATGSSGVLLFVWSPDAGMFVSNATLSSPSALRVEGVSETGFLLVTNSEAQGQLFDLNDQTEQELSLPTARHLFPFSLGSSMYIAVAISSQPASAEQSYIGQLLDVSSSADFFPRSTVLTFAPGQTSHRVVVEIIDDATPELDEQFTVELVNPVGGAVLGSQSSISITILTNDDAHGLIGFAESSLSVVALETDISSAVALDVVRERGTFGQVTASWEVTGDHTEGEVTPLSGEVVFAEGVSTATIVVTVQPDMFPELNEVTVISLTDITENGVPLGGDATRGAQLLPAQSQAMITVQANDAPHGVVVWSASVVNVTEEEGTDSVVQLTLLREFGSIGAIIITYGTFMNTNAPAEEQALQGDDYLPTTSSVVMADNVTFATILITILHDNDPELQESFLVSITDVQLVNEEDRQGSMSSSPRTNPGDETIIVQIEENDNSRGLLEFVQTEITVDETVGSITLEVVRTSGTFGRVGVDFTVSGVTATGGGTDFSPDSGSLEFEEDVSSQTITVDIINDSEAEFDESFIISLLNPQNGATVGDQSSVTVTISRNDDINGVFSFDMDSVLVLIPESEGPDDPLGLATLTILRTRNFVGRVTVYWEVSEEGRMDLLPTSGNVTFEENESEQSFQVRAIHDGVPELFEAFSLSLVSIDGGGRIGDPQAATIAIQASDDPSGVIGFDSYPDGILINEGDLLTFRLLRSAGLNDQVTATWEISPSDTTIFTTTSSTVVFADGQSEATVTVQTISNDIPEVARLFTLQIISTGQAAVNDTFSQVDVILKASDDPHGVVEFGQPAAVETEERATTVAIPVARNNGLVGDLRVNFSISASSTATSPEDYTLQNQSTIIPANMGSTQLLVTINDDTLPEVSETLSLSLASVELTQDINGGRDFDFSGDPSTIDLPPRLGSVTQFTITILENDDPYGIITFTSSTLVVTEGDTAVLSLERTGGTFGLVVLTVTVTSGTADTSDYTDITNSQVVFSQGQASADVSITTTQDTAPELQEDFTVSIALASTSSPAILEPITTVAVIIDASDSPNGVLGFEDPLEYARDNPSVDDGPLNLILRVNRMGGVIGQTQVEWDVVGPYPGEEMNDISPTGDILVMQDGQATGQINLDILPSDGDEEEKTFTVNLRFASNNVDINAERQTVTITIAQRGMPYGIIGFFGDALQPQKVNEGEENQTLVLPIARSSPALGNAEITFVVTGNTDPSLDVYPTSGTILFASGLSQVDLSLTILADAEPELEENFTIILSQATGGAQLDQLALRSTFTIRANDAPYGRFILQNPSITVDQSAPSIIARRLLYTITRESGAIGGVMIDVTTTYNPDPTAQYVDNFSTVILDGNREQQVSLPIASTAYLVPESTLTISISGATLENLQAQEGSGPEVSSPIQVTVTDDVANPLIGFDSNSLEATVDDDATEGSNVALTVVRSGQLGTVMVLWMTGLPNTTIANGSIAPEEGSILMTSADTSAVINLLATPREPHGAQEVFAVYLSVQPVTPQTFPAQVNPLTYISILEPSGVVQLASSTFSGVESSGNILVTVLRYYGSMGDIQVYGMAMVAPNTSVPVNEEAAVEGADFTAILVQVTIPDGSTSGVIPVSVVDNQESGPLKVFQFVLTSVTGDTSTSPRLASTGLSALLTIIDDEAGAGLFRIQPTADMVDEESERVSFTVLREGGSQGRVTVMVTTVEGNIEDTGSLAATDGVDYTGLGSQEVVFEDGDMTAKTFVIELTDDADPELAEQFTVVLSNPPGGSALIDPESDTLVVTIAASDNPGGVFSLSTSALSLSEDTAPSGTITVQRAGGTLTAVNIEWQALYTDNLDHETSIANILGMDRDVLSFPVGATSVDINLSLKNNSVPESGEQFTLIIQSDDSGIDFASPTEATITVEPRGHSVFQIAASDRRKVATTSGGLTVTVERVDGLQLTASVQYNTVQLGGPMTIGQLTFDAALFGVHFTDVLDSLSFTDGDTNMDIPLNIISTDVTRPVAFNITLTPSDPHQVSIPDATVVINPPGALSSLISIYFDALDSTTAAELESIAYRLYTLLSVGTQVASTTVFVNGEDQMQADTTRYIINRVTSAASTRYTDSLRGNMSDIFQRIIDDSTFSQRSQFIQSMQSFAYSLLDGQPCDSDLPVTMTFSRLLFYLEAVRLPPYYLPIREFSASSDSDFIRFPRDSIFAGNTLTGLDCLDIHYIEIFDEKLLLEPTLSNKVLSVGIRSQSTQTQSPITYRIYAGTRVMPSEKDCLLWNTTSQNWNDNICTTKRTLIQQQDYIECECYRLGEFAVTNNVERGYGWTIPAGAVAALVIIVIMLVIAVHVRYFRRTQLTTRIFLMLCVATLLFQLMLLVAVFASDRSDTTETGCSTIAIVLHFTAILQFIWVVALAVSLWVNFMGITDGKEPLIIYVIVCWVVAILWTMSTVLIGRFALSDLSFSDVYGLVGDFCFMPELSVSLVATVLPACLAMLATTAFLSHSCVYWSRWEDFHNMYLDSFNKTEIPLLVVFFVMVFLSSLTAYVHLYVREIYTFSIFVTVDFIQALYILIVYVFISWHTLARKHKKYGIEDEVEPLTVPGEPDYMDSFSTLASSRQQLNLKHEEARREERGGGSEDDTESLSDSMNVRPVVGLAMKRFPSVEQSLEGEDSQLDDLMFMLKTQNYPHDEEAQSLFPESPHKPSASEHMELRRISIADTHL